MIQNFVDPHFFEINIVDPQNGVEGCLKFFGFDDTFVICNMLTFGNKLHLIYHSEEILDG